MRIETHSENYPDHKLAELKVTTKARWTRFVVAFGTPPGSHIGFWRTNWNSLQGLNLRIGRRYRTCLTIFVHTKGTASS